jgi:hypothetical protein
MKRKQVLFGEYAKERKSPIYVRIEKRGLDSLSLR